ncbi:MAG: DUF2939 domain-containing protein [Alphaproteobacteria bacterium]|nr:DUF2939 domain-containing protein [Alphaproteobacteria bacterium]
MAKAARAKAASGKGASGKGASATAAPAPRPRGSIWPMAALAIVAALAFAPAYVRAAQTLAALEARDEAAIAQHVDFPALRADLEKDLSAALDAHYDDAGADDQAKALAAMIVSPFLDAIVEKIASPAGLAAAADAALGDRPPQGFGAMLGLAVGKGGFTGLSSFEVKLGGGADKKPTVLVFARRAGLDWRLAGVDLPPDALRP